MFRNFASGSGVALVLVAGVAVAGTKLGDADDTGFVPPTKDILKCETSVSKAAAKFSLATTSCHNKSAAAGVAGKPFGEETCEATAGMKYNAAVGKVAALCPPCLDVNAIVAYAETQLDIGANALIFCDSTSGAQLGDGNDEGWVPADKTFLKCQASVSKNLGKVVLALTTCHIKSATLQFKSTFFDEEACEGTALLKFETANGKNITQCPPCLAAALPSLAGAIEAGFDGASASTYCASPSGAFLDDQR